MSSNNYKPSKKYKPFVYPPVCKSHTSDSDSDDMDECCSDMTNSRDAYKFAYSESDYSESDYSESDSSESEYSESDSSDSEDGDSDSSDSDYRKSDYSDFGDSDSEHGLVPSKKQFTPRLVYAADSDSDQFHRSKSLENLVTDYNWSDQDFSCPEDN